MIWRHLGSRAAVAVVTALAALALAIVLLELIPMPVAGQGSTPAQGEEAASPKTPWGEPDLQGIWSVEVQIPLERPAGVTKPFYTEAEVAELDKQRATAAHFGDRIAPKGTDADVSGAYNPVFTSVRRTGRRTSLVIDPPDGKIPPLTAEARQRQVAYRQYQLALLQATESCRDHQPECAGGAYGPPSPLRQQPPPVYPAAGIGPYNRADGPEDRGLSERCMGGNLPEFRGGFTGIHRRIVQAPGVVYIFYDAGQGQGWTRVVPITTAPHLPPHVGQWWGDSRGRWEGNTLVVDVTNFNRKTDFMGSGENMHYVERWTRTNANTLELAATMEDPTTWTRPWTVQQEFGLQSSEANRVYAEPRCHEGNYGMMALLSGARTAEKDFAAGRGPHPATACLSGCGVDPEGVLDPLALR
jgi:hypothetical protein